MAENNNVAIDDAVSTEIIPVRLAITAMRDSGYKNTAYALAELIDNSIQAGATVVEVLCREKRELVHARERRRLYRIGVVDNGSGMNPSALRQALQFGNGTRLNDRSGIGRFGMGLPNASISQAQKVDVWSWQNGADNAIHTYIDLREIENGILRNVPEPSHCPVPDSWRELSDGLAHSGTLVVWSELDVSRLTWKSAELTLSNTQRVVGRIYRRFIEDNRVTIRLFAKEDGNETPLRDHPAVFDDPLYLKPSPAMHAPFDKRAMFKHLFDSEQTIEYNGEQHTVRVHYSLATDDTVTEAGTADRGQTKYGKHAAGNIGVSVLRAEREIMLDQGWCIKYDPRERWWGCEVEFPPALDELFGVTNNKQAATHFSEMATTDWKDIAEEGEVFKDVVSRLKEDDDPRGWLLSLADEIKRHLDRLRDAIKAQGAGRRSTRQGRHGTLDDVTATVNETWKERSKQHPIREEYRPPTEDDIQKIRDDLTEGKKYSEAEAESIVSLIQHIDLRVIFIEADFPNPFDLFNVETKGSITEIIFNRQHPAFDDIFGTVATTADEIKTLSKEEIDEQLTRAVNAIKITFAAWARYEREAGVDRIRALQNVRYEWGKIAAQFLRPDDDLSL